MSREISKWKCRNCSTEFYPDPPDFNCPNCKSSQAIPIKGSEKKKVKDWRHITVYEHDKERKRIAEEESIQLMNDTYVCHFQVPVFKDNLFQGYECSVTETSSDVESDTYGH